MLAILRRRVISFAHAFPPRRLTPSPSDGSAESNATATPSTKDEEDSAARGRRAGAAGGFLSRMELEGPWGSKRRRSSKQSPRTMASAKLSAAGASDGLAVGRAVHVARRPRRGVGEGRLPVVQEEGRDGLGQGWICARGGRNGEQSGRAAAGRDASTRLLAGGVEAETRLGLFARLYWAATGAAAHAAPVVDPSLASVP
jgi:hypothetical protein